MTIELTNARFVNVVNGRYHDSGARPLIENGRIRPQLAEAMADCLARGITHVRDTWSVDARPDDRN
jgi:hypothetical protein